MRGGKGRAGLRMIDAADVRAAIARHHHALYWVARQFDVTERTVRRWQLTGLALLYGRANITRAQWDAYVRTGKSGRQQPLPLSSTSQPVRRRTGGAGSSNLSGRSSKRTGGLEAGHLSGSSTARTGGRR